MLSRRELLKGLFALGAGALMSSCAAGTMDPRVPSVDTGFERFLQTYQGRRPDCPLPFNSFFLGGFECSTHRRSDRVRLDMTAATKHDLFADADYARLKSAGIDTCRDGVNWVTTEQVPGQYDFSRARLMIRAARRQKVSVIWDLFHFGWPDHLDLYSESFAPSFARYAAAFAAVLKEEADLSRPPVLSPINEISFLAWAGGDKGFVNPFTSERAFELKAQLIRATVCAVRAVRKALPQALFLHCDPIIHVEPHPFRFWERTGAVRQTRLRYQSWDMLMGCVWAQLGGTPDVVDIVGVNYYSNNQRFYRGLFLEEDDPRYMPLSTLLMSVWERYRKPILITETGIEGPDRPAWLRYVAVESAKALNAGCPLLGATWYPIVNHPGWQDERHCENGLWDYADELGRRKVYAPLEAEFRRLSPKLTALRNDLLSSKLQCRIPFGEGEPASLCRAIHTEKAQAEGEPNVGFEDFIEF